MKVQLPLFVYGTLGDSEVQRILFGESIKMSSAILKGYSIWIDQDGYFFLKSQNNSEINGNILELNSEQIWKADQWEEIPLYQRVRTTVMIENGKTCDAWVYMRPADTPGNLAHDLSFAGITRKEVFEELIKFNRQIDNSSIPS